MYSPKISEELIPDLYKIAKAKGIPMTRFVNQVLADVVEKVRVETKVIREKVEVYKEAYVIHERSGNETDDRGVEGKVSVTGSHRGEEV